MSAPATSERPALLTARRLSPHRTEWHLWNWEQWQRHATAVGDWESRASGGISSTSSRLFDAMCAEADTASARAVDAILDGLPECERVAVHHIRLLAVWHWRNEDPEFPYARAAVQIARGLFARGIV
jgi:hypothetical protein